MKQKELQFKDILLNFIVKYKLLLKKWKIIFLFGIIGGGLGIVKAYLSSPSYKGKISIIIEEENKGSMSGIASLASSFGLGGGGSGGGLFSKSNILEFLKTRSLTEKTLLQQVDHQGLKEMTFAQLYIEEYKWNENWVDNIRLSNLYFGVGEDRKKFPIFKDSILGVICRNLQKELIIDSPDDKNSIITIEAETKSEVFSKLFPEKLVELVSKYYIETKTKKTVQNIEIIQKQVDSVRFELNRSLSGLAQATDDVFGLNPSMNIKRIPSSKKQVDVQANTQILTELVKNLEVSKMNLFHATPFVQVIDRPIFPLQKEQLGKVKGGIIGGVLGGILIITFILMKDYFVNLMKTEKEQ